LDFQDLPDNRWNSNDAVGERPTTPFERETAVNAKPVTGSDEKVGENNGTQARRITGDNVSDYRERVQRVDDDSS